MIYPIGYRLPDFSVKYYNAVCLARQTKLAMTSDRHTPSIAIIAAVAANRTIGRDNTLPWQLPEDLKHFKALTMGNPIIMGRRTFESIGKPLPGRRNIVITRNADYQVPGGETVSSINDALKICSEHQGEIFIIGGGELYAQTLALANRLYLTEIGTAFEGDATFPEIDPQHWHVVAREAKQSTSGLAFEFVTYERQSDLT